MSTPDSELDKHLQALFGGLDTGADFDARLMARLRAESQINATARAMRARQQERARYRRALSELQGRRRSMLRLLTLDMAASQPGRHGHFASVRPLHRDVARCPDCSRAAPGNVGRADSQTDPVALTRADVRSLRRPSCAVQRSPSTLGLNPKATSRRAAADHRCMSASASALRIRSAPIRRAGGTHRHRTLSHA